MTYHASFADHLENPRNVGELPDASITVEEQNPACGDRLRLSLKVENDLITDIKIKAYGCPQTLAAASVMTELADHRSVDEALQLTRQQIADALGGLPRNKMHAAALAIDALNSALGKLTNQSNTEPADNQNRSF
ncbi:MAG TPA: iron-sulfur cluster assembly scaffold protein [Blastocatellia bacterium]|nr:iron-sulfur cluster assembly scaffold protein [Blastocatellia bacterium]